MQQVAERVSKLVESCDLSRAINLRMNVPPPTIASAITNKYAHYTQQCNQSTEYRIQHHKNHNRS